MITFIRRCARYILSKSHRVGTRVYIFLTRHTFFRHIIPTASLKIGNIRTTFTENLSQQHSCLFIEIVDAYPFLTKKHSEYIVLSKFDWRLYPLEIKRAVKYFSDIIHNHRYTSVRLYGLSKCAFLAQLIGHNLAQAFPDITFEVMAFSGMNKLTDILEDPTFSPWMIDHLFTLRQVDLTGFLELRNLLDITLQNISMTMIYCHTPKWKWDKKASDELADIPYITTLEIPVESYTNITISSQYHSKTLEIFRLHYAAQFNAFMFQD